MKICGVIWKLCSSIEAPETFVSAHFAVPFTHPLNPQNPAQGRVPAAALLGWCRSGGKTCLVPRSDEFERQGQFWRPACGLC